MHVRGATLKMSYVTHGVGLGWGGCSKWHFVAQEIKSGCEALTKQNGKKLSVVMSVVKLHQISHVKPTVNPLSCACVCVCIYIYIHTS